MQKHIHDMLINFLDHETRIDFLHTFVPAPPVLISYVLGIDPETILIETYIDGQLDTIYRNTLDGWVVERPEKG